MQIPIYANEEHKSIIEPYILMCKNFAEELATKNRYNSYLDVIETIIEYSNNYGTGTKDSGNFYDWLMVIPINLSVATNGFFCGLETKRNAAVLRAYKVVLEQMLHEVAEKLYELEPSNE
tara:strand:- start:733 stop:1092 length:360 start_codon:yes stop_codon:yes gene_type:complete